MDELISPRSLAYCLPAVSAHCISGLSEAAISAARPDTMPARVSGAAARRVRTSGAAGGGTAAGAFKPAPAIACLLRSACDPVPADSSGFGGVIGGFWLPSGLAGSPLAWMFVSPRLVGEECADAVCPRRWLFGARSRDTDGP